MYQLVIKRIRVDLGDNKFCDAKLPDLGSSIIDRGLSKDNLIAAAQEYAEKRNCTDFEVDINTGRIQYDTKDLTVYLEIVEK